MSHDSHHSHVEGMFISDFGGGEPVWVTFPLASLVRCCKIYTRSDIPTPSTEVVELEGGSAGNGNVNETSTRAGAILILSEM